MSNDQIIPASKFEMVQMVRDHIDVLKAKVTELGLTTALTTQLETQLLATEADEAALAAARLASKAATGTFDVSCTTLRALMQQCIDRIRIQAESTGNPDLWNAAQLPMPRPPQPAGAPVAGTDVTADPNADGTVTVKWKGTTAAGQFFTVWRRVGDAGTWAQIGSIAGRVRTFVDGGVPSPVTTNGASLFYSVRGQRGNQQSGDSNYGVVQYTPGPGLTLTATAPTRLAA